MNVHTFRNTFRRQIKLCTATGSNGNFRGHADTTAAGIRWCRDVGGNAVAAIEMNGLGQGIGRIELYRREAGR